MGFFVVGVSGFDEYNYFFGLEFVVYKFFSYVDRLLFFGEEFLFVGIVWGVK